MDLVECVFCWACVLRSILQLGDIKIGLVPLHDLKLVSSVLKGHVEVSGSRHHRR